MGQLKAIGLMTESLDAQAYVANARLAENAGFDSFWVPEDYAFPAAFAALGACAQATTRIKLGTGVVNPYTRHPVLLAMEFASLDQIAQGRALLGLGASTKTWIETQMGIPFDRPLSALRESIEVLRQMFRGEAVECDGRVFQIGAGMRFTLEPYRSKIPIYLGATGPRAMRLAGEVADGFLPLFAKPDTMRAAIETVKASAEQAGRNADDIDMSGLVLVSMQLDDGAAREAIKPLLATLFAWFSARRDVPVFKEFGIGPDELDVIAEAWAGGELRPDLISDAVIDGMAIAGSPERCREHFERLVEAGVTHPILAPFVVPEGQTMAQYLEALKRDLLGGYL